MDAVAVIPTGRARVSRQGLNQCQEARGLRRVVDRHVLPWEPSWEPFAVDS
jgi:hypothetical protein